MARYQAQQQSLYGNVGAPNAPRPSVDIGSALDAVTSGATSLIHAAMMRRQTENENAIRREQIGIERQRVGIEQQREARDQANQEREFGLKQEAERHRFIEAGGIPAHTDTQAVGTQTPIAPIQPIQSRVARAMTAGEPQMPGVQVTPSNAPGSVQPAAEPTSTTVYHPENVETPESFDPKRGAAYERGVAVQQLRNEGFATRDEHRQEFTAEQQAKRLAAQKEARTFARETAMQVTRLRSQLQTQKGAGRAMTANAIEQSAQRAAMGLIDKFDGDANDAQDFLENTKEGQELVKRVGVQPEHLMYARSQWMKTVSGQANRLQSGALGMEPSEAVTAVTTTRKLVGGGKTATAPTGGETSTETPAKPAASAKPAAKPAAKPSAPPADDFSDDEIADAMQAGKTTAADVRAFITDKRKKKSGGKK